MPYDHSRPRRRPAKASFARSAGTWILLAIMAVLAVPATLLAHQLLRSAEPARDATVDAVPPELRLTFSEPVRLEFTELTARGPDGGLVLGPLRRAADDPRVLVAPVEGGWHPGEFSVHWVTVGSDGHRTDGRYVFTVLDGAAGLPEPEPDPAADRDHDPARDDATDPAHGDHHDPALFPETPSFGPGSPAFVAIRALLFLALVALIGAVALRLVVLPMTALRWPEDARLLHAGVSRGAVRIGTAAAIVLLVAAFGRLWAQTASLFGPGSALDGGNLASTIGFQPWGTGWLLQVIGAAVALAGFLLARARPGPGWTLAALGALGAAVAPALAGHAVASGALAWLAVPVDAVHVLAAGGWIGSLFALVVVGLPTALRLEPGRRGTAAAALVHGFSPTALAFTGTLVATGVVSAWIHLGEITALWTTDYGRILLMKVSIFAAVAVVGAYNLLRVRPALGEERGARRLRRSGTLELVLALAVIIVTAILVAVPPPAT
jgi:putative copper export protein/methionine-rich copper-binding protein CopC